MDAEAIAKGLSEAQREKLRAIAMPVNEYFRLDEGEAHSPYTVMKRMGLLGADRFGDFGTLYYLTPNGLAVRAILKGES